MWHFLDSYATPKADLKASELRETWEKLHKDDNATEKQLDAAWHELVDAEMREELNGHRPTLLQVWFPGVHINAGGGSSELLTTKRDDFERKSISQPFIIWIRFLLLGGPC